MKFSNYLNQLLIYADIDIPVKKVLETITQTVIGTTIIVSAIMFYISFTYFVFSLILTPIIIFSSMLILIYFQGAQRASITEEVLPEALTLMSTNLKSGLTPDRALLITARPEFGPLEKELKLIAKESLTNTPFEDAIMESAKKFNSIIVPRAFKLISEGIKRGGEMESILENTASHIREILSLKKHIRAEVTVQMLFIIFAAVIAAPLMFGVSTVIIEKMSSIGVSFQTGVPSNLGSNLPNPSAIASSAKYMLPYALIAIMINSLFASLIIGLIKDGRKITGLKYFPAILLISMLVVFISRYLMGLTLHIV